MRTGELRLTRLTNNPPFYDKKVYAFGPLRSRNNRRQVLLICCLALVSTVFTACPVPGRKECMYVKRPKDSASTTSGQAPSPHGATILLFVGTGTSPSDVAAIETILDGNHLNYSTANSSQLNKMSESQIGEYQLLIFPGGNFIDMGKSLTSGTVTSIGAAV